MSKLVKVYNRNEYPFEQEFKGDTIRIEPGRFVEMDWYSATEFLGKYFPPKFDGSDQQLPQSFKKLEIVGRPPHMDEKANHYICQACGDEFAAARDLENHIDRHHLDQLDDVKVAQARRTKAKPEVNDNKLD